MFSHIFIIFFSFLLALLSACAPNPLPAKAPHNPLPVKNLSLNKTPSLDSFKKVELASIILWPKEEDLPFIIHSAKKEIAKINSQKNLSNIDSKKIAGYYEIIAFKTIEDVQRFISKHGTFLDDSYLLINQINEAKEDIKKIAQEKNELAKDILSYKNKDLILMKTKQNVLKDILPCWLLKSDFVEKKQGSCLSKIPSTANANDYIRYYPTACDDFFLKKIFGVRLLNCQEKISQINDQHPEYLKIEQEELAQNNEYMSFVATIEKKERHVANLQKRMKDDGLVEIDLMQRALQNEDNSNILPMDELATKFFVDFQNVENSSFVFPIKNFTLKSITNMVIEEKDKRPRLRFIIHGERKGEDLSLIQITTDLRFYDYKGYVVFAGKIKLYNEQGEERKGMMKVVQVPADF